MNLLSGDGKRKRGYPVVLTTDRTLASDYNGSEFLGFGATFPKILPDFLYQYLFLPKLSHDHGSMKFGHCGTRKIEASLLNNGFSRDEVKLANPIKLSKVVGPDTEVIGITTNDPLGKGPASTTFSQFVRKEPYTKYYFRKLLNNGSIQKNDITVIVGGPGTWQLKDEEIMDELGIDCIVIGEGEKVAPNLFEKAMNGEDIPRIVQGEVVSREKIPRIKGPTINGLVEISRGCGRGCDFCNPTLLNLRHRHMKHIIEEIKLNKRAGCEHALLHAEDVLRYGSKRLTPEPDKLMKLLKKVRKLTPDVRFSHCSMASVVSEPGLIEDVTNLFDFGRTERPFASAQIGIETGSTKLAKKHLKGKAKPFDVEEWPSVVEQGLKILNDNHWIPCTTLIMGLPGEDRDDVTATLELLDDIKDYDFFIVPLMFVPLGMQSEKDFFTRDNMEPEHWQLLAECMKKDFDITESLIHELSGLEGFNPIKEYSFVLLKKYMEKRMKPYIKSMEQGIDPSDNSY